MALDPTLTAWKREDLADRRERVRQMREETALLNADSAVWLRAEADANKRKCEELRKAMDAT